MFITRFISVPFLKGIEVVFRCFHSRREDFENTENDGRTTRHIGHFDVQEIFSSFFYSICVTFGLRSTRRSLIRDQFRFLWVVFLSNHRCCFEDLILSKDSVMRVSIPLDLWSLSLIPLLRHLLQIMCWKSKDWLIGVFIDTQIFRKKKEMLYLFP